MQTIAYEYPTKSTSKSGSREEQGNTIILLVPFVPHAHIKYASWDESTFHETEEETRGDESGKILRNAREGSYDPPGEGKSR